MTRLTIDFFHDCVCCWSFNISLRLRNLAGEMPLDVRHRTFVLQANREEMRARWGDPDTARATILGHWAVCREASDRPDLIDIAAMAAAGFDYPPGLAAARACKAAEALGGQAAHWDLFDRIQRAHLAQAENIADPAVLTRLAGETGLDLGAFARAFRDPALADAIAADRRDARRLQVAHVPTLIVRETGTRLVNGPTEDLRAQLRAAQRLAA